MTNHPSCPRTALGLALKLLCPKQPFTLGKLGPLVTPESALSFQHSYRPFHFTYTISFAEIQDVGISISQMAKLRHQEVQWLLKVTCTNKVAEAGSNPRSVCFYWEPPSTTPPHALCSSAQMATRTEVVGHAQVEVRFSVQRDWKGNNRLWVHWCPALTQ